MKKQPEVSAVLSNNNLCRIRRGFYLFKVGFLLYSSTTDLIEDGKGQINNMENLHPANKANLTILKTTTN